MAPSYLQLPMISSEYLQAVTACSLSVVEKTGMDELSATLANWNNIVKMILQNFIKKDAAAFYGRLPKRLTFENQVVVPSPNLLSTPFLLHAI
jgi:hypothetical protein